jgi:MFS family permease
MDHETKKSYIVRTGLNSGFILGFVLTVGIGAINFGYSIGVFNSLMVDFFIVFGIPEEHQAFWASFITSVTSIGAAIGALTCGPFQRYGKKNCIHVTNAILIVGCSLTLVQKKEVVAVGRFFFGLAAGAFSVFVPSFINELTPTELKGQYGSATQILITVGIFVSNLLGIPLPDNK